jgi:hypothetical protein
MIGLNYVMDIQALIDPSYIQGIDSLSGKDELNLADIILIITIKNGFLGYLQNELPEVSDFVILNGTIISFLTIMTDDFIDFSLLDLQAQAMQQHMAIDLAFEFLKAIDLDYIQAFINVSKENVEPAVVKAFLIENIELINTFIDEHQNEFDAINLVMSAQDREDLFFNFLIDQVLVYILESQGNNPTEINEMIQLLHEAIQFDALDALPGMMSHIIKGLLDELMISEYAILDQIIVATTLSPEDFSTYQDYEMTQNWENIQVIFELIDLINPVVHDLSADEYQAVLDTAVSILTVISHNEIDFTLLNTTALSEQDMMFMNLIFDLISSRDDAYELALEEMIFNPNDPYYVKELIKANITLLDTFFINHETDIDVLMNVMTLEERQAFFNDFIIDELLGTVLMMNMDESMATEMLNLIHESINFEALDALPNTMGDVFKDMIHQMVITDFEMFENLYEALTLNPDDFLSFEAYQEAHRLLYMDLLLSSIDLLAPVVEDLTVEEYQSVIDTVISIASIALNGPAFAGHIDFDYMDTSLISETEMRAMNLFFDFLTLRDADYEAAFEAVIINPNDVEVVRTFIIENIELIDAFLTTYEADIQALNNVSTLEERSAFLHDFMIDQVLVFIFDNQAIDPIEANQIITLLHSAIDYEAIDGLPSILTGAFSDLVDELIASNYEALDMFINAMELSPEDYLSYDDYRIGQDWANIQLVLSIIDLIHPVITQLSVEEYQYVLDTAVSVLTIASKGEIDFTYFNTSLLSEADKMMVDLFMNFLSSRDAGYEAALEAVALNPYDPMLAKAFVIENIDLIDQFLVDYQDDIDALFALSTQQERSDLFLNFFIGEILEFAFLQGGMDPLMVDDVINYLQTNIDYLTIETLAYTISDSMNEILEALILSDYQLVDDIFTAFMIDSSDYLTMEEYYDALDAAQFDIILSLIDLGYPVVQYMMVEEYQSVIDSVYMVIDIQLGLDEIVNGMDYSDQFYVIDELKAAFDQTADNQLAIIQEVISYASLTTRLEDFYATMTSTTLSEEEKLYTSAIIMATVFNELNPMIITDVNAMSAVILNLLDDEIFVANMNIDPLDVSNIQAFINVQIPEILSQSGIIYQYDVNSLTFEEIQNIMAFLTIFGMAPAF